MRIVRSSIPELDGMPLAQYRVEFAKRQRRLNIAANLTHDGRTRQRARRVSYPDLAALPPRARAVARVRRWRLRHKSLKHRYRGALNGLTGQARYRALAKLRRIATKALIGRTKAPARTILKVRVLNAWRIAA